MPHGDSPRHARRPRSKRRAAEGSARSPRTATDEPPASAPAPGRGALAGGGAQRLQKLLAAAGFGSRRVVERFLTEERVTVNGRVATLGDRADPLHDEIRVDGERLARERPAYWIVNKPRGVVTTVRDEAGRRTVVDLLPRKVGRLFPVGRLDRETSGLLLLTNDGDAAHVLLHPSLGNEREYRVQVKGQVEDRTIARLERGVNLEEGRTSPMEVSDVRFDPESGTTSLGLTLVEGKKRQIRRSLLVLGHPVRRLVRVRMGPLRIGRLAVGEARPLRSEEKRALLDHVERLRRGERPKVTRPPSGPSGRGSSSRGAGASTRKTKGARSAGKKVARKKKAAARRGAARNKPAKKPARKPARKRAGKKSAARREGVGKSAAKRGAAKKKRARKGAARNGPKPGGQRPPSSRRGTRR